jgi:hypothetical protein
MATKKSSRSSAQIEWNRVTWYSRMWALFVFLLIIPVISFYIGTQYERTVELLAAVAMSAQ